MLVWSGCPKVERSAYNLAFCAMVFLEHLNVRIVGQAVLAHGGEVGGLPSGPVQILLNLWRGHVVVELISCASTQKREALRR